MRFALSLLVCLVAAACSPVADLEKPVEPIGAFRLGHAVVVADGARKVQPSRNASADEWEAALRTELERRFRRFEGTQLYHIAVKVDAYALAPPGVPIVLSPKSVLSIGVSVWDDAAGGKLNEEPRRFTVFERFSGETVIGSGLTRTREQQMQSLAANAARLIERWMRDNPGWFAPRPAPLPAAVPAPRPPAAPSAIRDAPGVSPDIGEVITPAR